MPEPGLLRTEPPGRARGPGPTLRAWRGLARASLQVALAYRGRMVLWVLSGFFPLLLMAVWLTVVAESGPPNGWTSGDFLGYYSAAAVMWNVASSHIVWEWDQDMRSGDLSNKLLRPVHPFLQYAAADLGQRTVLAAGLVPLWACAALVVPGLDYGADPALVLLTAASGVLAWALSVVMGQTVALLGFWSTQTTNIWMLWWGLGSFVSGWVAPVDLMPGWLRSVAVLLPFRSTIGFPAELISGRLNAVEIAAGFAVGAAWTAAFGLVYVIGWRHGVRRFQAVAG
ncbi:MAG: ABC transporter permease [Nocardioides sp.]